MCAAASEQLGSVEIRGRVSRYAAGQGRQTFGCPRKRAKGCHSRAAKLSIAPAPNLPVRRAEAESSTKVPLVFLSATIPEAVAAAAAATESAVKVEWSAKNRTLTTTTTSRAAKQIGIGQMTDSRVEQREVATGERFLVHLNCLQSSSAVLSVGQQHGRATSGGARLAAAR